MLGRSLVNSFVKVPRPCFSQTRFYAGGGGGAETSGSKKKLLLSFSSPYEVVADGVEINSITVPGQEGRFGIYPEHVPTIAQLAAGVVEVATSEGTKKYFVGAGFVGVNPDSTCNVTVTECFPLEEMDKVQAQAGLEEAKKELQSATDETQKIECRIKVETFEKIIQEVA